MDEEKLEREAAKILFSTPSKAEDEGQRAKPDGPEILFVCPFCNESYQVSAELAGKKINCRNCREPYRVDSIKSTGEQRVGVLFWLGLGVVVGVSLSIFVVSVLKLMRLI